MTLASGEQDFRFGFKDSKLERYDFGIWGIGFEVWVLRFQIGKLRCWGQKVYVFRIKILDWKDVTWGKGCVSLGLDSTLKDCGFVKWETRFEV